MKKLIIGFLFVLQAVCAQETSLQGKVLDAKTLNALPNASAVLKATGQTALTDTTGLFIFTDMPEGYGFVTISQPGYIPQTFSYSLGKGQSLNLGIVALDEDVTAEQQLSIITLTDTDLGDSNGGSETTAGLLQASRDIFQQAAAFNWGQARFRVRGLDNTYGTTMINGVTMNKIYDGRPQWSNWGGLNDATRNQEYTMGSSPSDYTFGYLLGTQEINTRASLYRSGTRVSFSGSNTNYNWRAMGTYASGLSRKGWAYVISASGRWAQEGYFDGTGYNANSIFTSIEKKLNDKQSLNFTGIYAQNSRDKNSPNTAEVTSLMGEKYNAYWGWQDGEKRNSREKDIAEPIFMLSHYWKISNDVSLNTNVAYQFGKIGNSRIDFQNAPNPDPTYYQNLPSYYTSMYINGDGVPASAYQPGGLGGIYTGNTPQNTALAQQNHDTFLANSQINWNAMYFANTKAVTDSNGNETDRSPGISRYVLYEDRTDDNTFTANTVLRSQLSTHITLNAAATYKRLSSHNYQNLLDLLGGAYYNDIDPFYTGSQAESDLNHPGRQVRTGDTFGYNYNLDANTYDAFTQFKFLYRKVDFYLAQNYSHSDYQRDGLYKNGIYADTSFGKSDRVTFENFGFKGGFTYKIDGRNQVSTNAVYMTKAPTLRNTFPNARMNNSVIDGIGNETIAGGDINYIIRTPRFKARFTGFYNTINNAVETSFFFAEGVYEGNETADQNAFVAETVTGINKKMMGTELGAEYNITTTIKLSASVAYGQYTYNNNPNVSLNNDAYAALEQQTGPINTKSAMTNFGPATLKNYKLPGMPQQAYSVGIEYRDPDYWWIGGNANYLAANYLDISALLRTDNFLQDPQDVNGFPFPEITPERTRQLLKQERLPDFYLVNLQGGKSWKKGHNIFGFFASINNVFDVSYKTGGFEQARNANYRQLNQDVSSGTPAFGPKYYYGYGRTYFLNLYLNFW
jgi:hypothetical protein